MRAAIRAEPASRAMELRDLGAAQRDAARAAAAQWTALEVQRREQREHERNRAERDASDQGQEFARVQARSSVTEKDRRAALRLEKQRVAERQAKLAEQQGTCTVSAHAE